MFSPFLRLKNVTCSVGATPITKKFKEVMIFMDFIEYNQCSKIQDLYYARLLNCGVARNIVSGEASLSNKNET